MWSNDCYLPRLMIITPSIPQSQAYHDFADQRSFFGLMNTREITESYDGFFTTVESLIDGTGDFSVEKEFMSHVSTLCKYGLDSLVHDHFLISLLQAFEKSGALSFSHHFDDCSDKNHTISRYNAWITKKRFTKCCARLWKKFL
ncbi:anaphase-promoting complex subunit 2 isoform X8 [Brassica napus]|uniref:anaphase-promoting complex subunit 2-like isoform X7 n=1 Tax=Brassica oleracea var. oleracea TaxID=109376 RepID=UPI0006A6BCBD|nr:PREDICTED: anaphase-promoting complex subunit 2-like isoform X7 [Brassica oleracea var. oleracea]XP_048622084.1 anaphase-promoting complex subunit 2 isoform X8 [Brassica napus]